MMTTKKRWAFRLLLLATIAALAPACRLGQKSQPRPAPVLDSVTPPQAHVGDVIHVGGSGFGTTQSRLTVSGVAADIVAWSDTLIQAIIPVGASTGEVIVRVSGRNSNPGVLVILGPPPSAPVLDSVTPPEAHVWEVIQVSGSGFGSTQGSLTVSGVAAGIVAWSDTVIQAIVPVGASTGEVIVWVGGMSSNPGSLTILGSPQNVPVCTAAGGQFSPEIVADGSGGAIMVWQDNRAGNLNIYAQRVNSSGVLLWTTDGVPICTAVDEQSLPQIVSDGAGGAIIVWQDKRDGTAFDIFAQRVNGSGVPQWTLDGIALCTAPNWQGDPQLVTDGSGGAIVVWSDYRVAGNYHGYAQRINGAGAVQWATDGVAFNVKSVALPQIDTDGSGGVIIVWQDYRNQAVSLSDVYAQRLDATGAIQWATDGVPLCTMPEYQFSPHIVSDGSGGGIVVWSDGRTGQPDYHLYAQHVTGAGAQLWPTDGLAVCTADPSQSFPQIISDGSGGAIMTWQDSRSGNIHIYSQRVSGAGALLWTADGVPVCTAPIVGNLPQLATDGSGGAILVWQDWRAGIFDVFAQRVNSAGLVQWTPDGVALGTAVGHQQYPQIVSDGLGGAIIVWEDYRSGADPDIYAQGVSSNGLP